MSSGQRQYSLGKDAWFQFRQRRICSLNSEPESPNLNNCNKYESFTVLADFLTPELNKTVYCMCDKNFLFILSCNPKNSSKWFSFLHMHWSGAWGLQLSLVIIPTSVCLYLTLFILLTKKMAGKVFNVVATRISMEPAQLQKQRPGKLYGRKLRREIPLLPFVVLNIQPQNIKGETHLSDGICTVY